MNCFLLQIAFGPCFIMTTESKLRHMCFQKRRHYIRNVYFHVAEKETPMLIGLQGPVCICQNLYYPSDSSFKKKKFWFVSPALNTMPWDYYIPFLYLMIILKQVNMCINDRQRYIENIAYTAQIRMQFSNLHLCTLNLISPYT